MLPIISFFLIYFLVIYENQQISYKSFISLLPLLIYTLIFQPSPQFPDSLGVYNNIIAYEYEGGDLEIISKGLAHGNHNFITYIGLLAKIYLNNIIVIFSIINFIAIHLISIIVINFFKKQNIKISYLILILSPLPWVLILTCAGMRDVIAFSLVIFLFYIIEKIYNKFSIIALLQFILLFTCIDAVRGPIMFFSIYLLISKFLVRNLYKIKLRVFFYIFLMLIFVYFFNSNYFTNIFPTHFLYFETFKFKDGFRGLGIANLFSLSKEFHLWAILFIANFFILYSLIIIFFTQPIKKIFNFPFIEYLLYLLPLSFFIAAFFEELSTPRYSLTVFAPIYVLQYYLYDYFLKLISVRNR